MRRATAERRWLLVKITDVASAACWKMAQTTWQDPNVIGWVNEHAIAIEVDAGRDPSTAAALALIPPAVVLLRDGEERARLVGSHDPEHLLRWLEQADGIEARVAEARAALTDPDRDAAGRNHLARALLYARRFEEALDQYVWLWLHMAKVGPAMSSAQVTFLAWEIGKLCRELPAAHQRFCQLRDDSESAAIAPPAERPAAVARYHWVMLNDSLGEATRTLAWFDGLAPKAQLALDTEIVAHVMPILLERERWADAGRLIGDPLEVLRAHGAVRHIGLTCPVPDTVARDRLAKSMLKEFRNGVSQLVRSLRAAGRDLDAAAVKREAQVLDDSPEMQAALR